VFSPTTFGKYYLYEQLASGGMAEIFKAKLLGPGGFEKLLVIKQIKPELARRREFVEMFVDEAKVTVQLSHGNIVPVYELGMVDGTYFIAMEYVDGPALADVLRVARKQGKKMDPALAAHIAVEMLKGLDYAHRQRILHRDLSPGNILISRQGEVKIVDFGLATSEARLVGRKLVGSYAYMSPEQADSATLDARSDLFSCGVLLWEMLSGKTLFVDEDDEKTLARVRTAEVPAVEPRELDDVIKRAAARDANQRFGRAADFQAALVRWLYGAGTLPSQDDVGNFVREVMPPPAREKTPPPADATPIMGVEAIKSAVKEVSFATNVTFEREVLTRAGLTPHAGTKAMTRALPRKRRGWVVAAVALAGTAAAAAIVSHRKPNPTPPPHTQTQTRTPTQTRTETQTPTETPTPPPVQPPAKKVAVSHPTKTVVTPPPPAKPTADPAQLTLNATPWADFYLDGKKLPGCPVVGYSTSSGDHAVRVVCPDRQERTQAVSLASGAREKRVFDCNQSGIPVVGQ
jgi:serine/threonine protein kinase